MMKRYFILLLCAVSTGLSAQWRITGCDRADRDGLELLQIIDLDSATFIYGTLTNEQDSVCMATLNRKTCVYVNGEPYRLIHSVNLPIMDEADTRWSRLDRKGDEVNFCAPLEHGRI